jgi:hypothetical protein
VGTKLGTTGSAITLRLFTLQGNLLFSEEYGNFTATQINNYFRDYTVTPGGNILLAASTQPVQGGQTFIFELNSNFEKTHTFLRSGISMPIVQKISSFNLLGRRLPLITTPLCKSPGFLLGKKVDIKSRSYVFIK